MAVYSPFIFFLSQFFWIINPSMCYFFLGYQFIYMLFLSRYQSIYMLFFYSSYLEESPLRLNIGEI